MSKSTYNHKRVGLQGFAYSLVSSYLSFTLSIFDECSNIAHYILHVLLSPLPITAWKPLKVHIPKGNYHPAVLVTGTGSGTGRELALTLAQKGYTVFAGVLDQAEGEKLLNDFMNLTNKAPLRNNPQSLKNPAYKGGILHPLVLDVTHPEHIRNAFETISKHIQEFHIPLVALFNNAGHVVPSPLETSNKIDWKETFEVNLFGAMGLVNLFLPLLRESQGRIINVGSIASWVPTPALGSYSAAKAALHAASSSIRIEVRQFGVGVSLIEPGIIRTPEPNKIEETLKDLSSKPSSYAEAINTHRAKTIYEPSVKKLSGVMGALSELEMPPFHVTNAALHALTSPWPKNNYLIGWDSKMLATARWVFGEGLFDVILD